jgi:mono/diheme cytochrome c family protein
MTSARPSRSAFGALFLASQLLPAGAEESTLALGRKVFLEISQPQCALCHTLAAAGAAGEIGPILDDLKPTADRVRTAVTNGIGPMPPNTSLTREQVDAVAIYVSTVAGKSAPK